MPEEILALSIITIIAFSIITVVGMTLRYKYKKSERLNTTGSSSLTTSELERMMKRAVKEETDLLNDKMDRLSKIIVPVQITPKLDEARPDLLADIDLHQTDKDSGTVRHSRQARV